MNTSWIVQTMVCKMSLCINEISVERTAWQWCLRIWCLLWLYTFEEWISMYSVYFIICNNKRIIAYILSMRNPLKQLFYRAHRNVKAVPKTTKEMFWCYYFNKHCTVCPAMAMKCQREWQKHNGIHYVHNVKWGACNFDLMGFHRDKSVAQSTVWNKLSCNRRKIINVVCLIWMCF